MKISAVIITYNEEKNIENALKSVNWCDEIIIIDSGSTDKTIDICKNYNCKIFFKQLDGFGEQKRFAVEKTSNNWVLSIDSDEVITEDLKNEILSDFKNRELEITGFDIPRSLIFLGKKLRYAGSYSKKNLRLFDKTKTNFNLKKVHESVERKGKILQLKNEILHYSYNSIFDYFKKFNFYTELAATEIAKKNKRYSNFYPVIRFPLDFFKRYFLQFGFFDGYYGFIWSFYSAFYASVKYMKVIEMANHNIVRI